MNTKQVLIEARALIADIEHWCQEDYAQDDCGVGLLPNSEHAYCYCAGGAVYKVGGAEFDEEGNLIENELTVTASQALHDASAKLFPPTDPTWWASYVEVNDGGRGVPADAPDNVAYAQAHANILKVFDAAIEAAG